MGTRISQLCSPPRFTKKKERKGKSPTIHRSFDLSNEGRILGPPLSLSIQLSILRIPRTHETCVSTTIIVLVAGIRALELASPPPRVVGVHTEVCTLRRASEL